MTTRAGRPTIWLEVAYDGTRPPKALFADLATIGFEPPTEMPPPSSAMDWSAPDPRTGRPYSVLPHRVEWTIEPPPGTGYKRSWTPSERAAYERSLMGVLQRHGLGDLQVGATMEIPDPDSLDARPPPPHRAAPTAPAETAEAPAETAEVAVTEPEVSGFVAVHAPATSRWFRVTITSRGESLDDARRALQTAGMAVRPDQLEQHVEQRFRGSINVTTRYVPCLDVLCDEGQRVVLEPVLESSGLDSTLLRFDVTAARPSDLARFLSEAGPAGVGSASGDTRDASLASIRTVFDPSRRSAVDDGLDELCVEDRSARPATRQVVHNYRGSPHVTTAPAIELEIWVDPAQVGAVVAVLTRVAGIDGSDESQVKVTLPRTTTGQPEQPQRPQQPETLPPPASPGPVDPVADLRLVG